MCMIAAAFVAGFRYPGKSRHQMQFLMLRMLVPSLLPLATGTTSGGIDYAAHFGGALTGLILSGVLLRAWPRSEPAPRLAPLAKAVAGLGLIVFADSAYLAFSHHQVYALDAYLIPDAEIPENDDELYAKSAALAEAYPRDPRARFFHAAAVMEQDFATAERELRAALAEKDMLDLEFEPSFRITIVAYLARVLINQGQADQARLEAKPYCYSGKDGSVPEDLAPLDVCAGQ